MTATAIPAVGFLRSPTAAWAKRVETMSGLWPLVTYLLLGAGPFVARLLQP